MKTINIDGIEYVEKSQTTPEKDGMPYVMIRTENAGVHCGYLKRREGREVELLDSIRIWYWDGAASISQLSQEGTNAPENCKFAMPIASVILTEAIEIIPMTVKAVESIKSVESWKN